MLKETTDFAESVEVMMRKTLGIPVSEEVSNFKTRFNYICHAPKFH